MSTTRRSFLKQNAAQAARLLGAAGLLNVGSQLIADDAQPLDLPVTKVIADNSRNAPLSMLFDGKTADECRAWQKKFSAQLAELLGDFDPPQKWKVEEEGGQEFDDHVRHDLMLHAEGVPTMPVYLLLPKSASATNKVAGVVCVHGHGSHGNHPIVGRTDLEGVAGSIKSAHYDYGLQFVRRGYAVAAPCLIPFGRRLARSLKGGSDPCAVTFVRMLALGQLPMAANLRDIRWSIDLLQSRPEVASDCIGCAGLSYGGRMTMLAAAMDPRIKAACISGALNLLQERITHRYSCGSQVIPGLLTYGDYSEIGSLIAPRPAVWEVGAKDGLITESWASLFKERLRKAYGAYGKSNNLQFDHYDGGHRWNGELAYPLFDEVLKQS